MKKILIIEDEKDVRELYRRWMEDLYELDFAVNGQDGFDKGCTNEYDLIITDLKMPNWNGAESIAAMDFIVPNKKYVIVSGFLEEKSFQALLDTIPFIMAKIAKPVLMQALLEIVEKALAVELQSN